VDRRRLITAMATLAVGVAAAVPVGVLTAPTATAATAWSLISPLAEHADGGTLTQATNRSGLMVAAWVDSTQLRTSFRAPGGPWQSPVTVITRPTATSGNVPAIVLDDTGTATVLWVGTQPGSSTEIYSASGTTSGWSSPELRQGPVAGPLEDYSQAERPVLAVGKDGTVYAAWYLEGCAEYAPPNPRDNYCVTHVNEEYVASRSPSGTWSTPELLDTDMRFLDIAVGPDETVVVSGSARAESGDNRRLAMAVTRPRGGAWSTAKVLNSPGRSMAFSMQVHLTADDTDVTAVFGECDVAISCRVASSRGPVFDTSEALSAEVDHHDGNRVNVEFDPIRLASSPVGEVTAIWNLDVGGADAREGVIQSSRRSPGSDSWDVTRTLSAELQNGQTMLADLAVDDSGTAVASWNSVTYDPGFTRHANVVLRGADGTWNTPAELQARDDANLMPMVGPVSTRGGSGFTALTTAETGVGWSDRIDDTGRPLTHMTRGATLVSARRFPVTWSASDGESAIARTTVQRRSAPWRGTFGHRSVWRSTSRGGTTTVTHRGRPGRTYCFRARSADAAGNIGPWSAEQCRSTPVDDRTTQATSGWRRAKATGAYLGTETVTSKHGSRLVLRGARGRRYALLATTCRSCGSISVSIGAKVVRTISLRSGRTVKRHIVPVAAYGSVHTGKVVLTVRSHGRPVHVDGILVAR
jgi:hypothetical protein